MVLFYFYIRVRQFHTELCGYGDLPQSVSTFISVMAVFGIIWTFLPFACLLLQQCCCRWCCCRCTTRLYGPVRLKNALCKLIAVVSAIGFVLSTAVAAWFLVENRKQRNWTLIATSLLIFKFFDIWLVLCLQNGCDVKSVIAVFGIYRTPRTDYQAFRMSYTQSDDGHQRLT